MKKLVISVLLAFSVLISACSGMKQDPNPFPDPCNWLGGTCKAVLDDAE